MQFTSTNIPDLYLLEPKVWEDSRGYFFESYSDQHFEKAGLQYSWVQDNEAFSTKGTLRGLHFQKGEYAQAKLVRVVSGEVLDVVVDIRPDSPTFGQQLSVILNGKNKKQLLVPRGMAHGYLVLSKEAVFQYKVDNLYNKESEAGIIYNDEDLAIDWVLSQEEFILSDKDLVLPKFKELFPR